MLGIGEPDIYGKETYKSLCDTVLGFAKRENIDVTLFQSNYEGEIVDTIQKAYKVYDGIVINPAAYTHTSVAILDALKAVGIPTVEVHISDVSKREDFRQISYVRDYCERSVIGHGIKGYLEAMDFLREKYEGNNK